MMGAVKGIILAGGSGTRLHPLTHVISKQLLPVYDKPMIYYPLSVLMLAGIREVMVITTPQDARLFTELLGDGARWGMAIHYAVQPEPGGLAQAFIIARRFIGNDRCSLILGDNIFYAHGFQDYLTQAVQNESGATVFGYWVRDPERYGVAEFDSEGRVIRLVEKPPQPKSNYAITGLYFYDNQVVEMAAHLEPSARGELEITDINSLYLKQQKLSLIRLGRGVAWLDTGTHASLLQASNFIQTIEERQGLKICCPEEIAFNQRWIDAGQLESLAAPVRKSGYGDYLLKLLEMGRPE